MLEIIIAIIVFILDFFSKVLVLDQMQLAESIEVIPKIFHLTYVQNTGLAFGMLNGNNTFLLILLLGVFPILVFFMRKDLRSNYLKYKHIILFRLSVGFFLGGAFGNIFDRIFRGYVIDMFDFLIWPVFNIADSFICIAMVIFSYYLIIAKGSSDSAVNEV
ncbi:MAG: signal peptidase II [Bacteroidetes bacterium]|nr:signal peptidase II [Bacteroidota bacterium]